MYYNCIKLDGKYEKNYIKLLKLACNNKLIAQQQFLYRNLIPTRRTLSKYSVKLPKLITQLHLKGCIMHHLNIIKAGVQNISDPAI